MLTTAERGEVGVDLGKFSSLIGNAGTLGELGALLLRLLDESLDRSGERPSLLGVCGTVRVTVMAGVGVF